MATIVTVWLATVAALVALLAYLVADESPDLAILINGATPAEGIDILLGDVLSDRRYEILAPPEIRFKIENSSAFSARSPVIEVAFTDVWLHAFDPKWSVFRQTGDDMSLQWSGGSDITVHGKGRIIPTSLGLAGNGSWARTTMTLTIEAFCRRLSPQAAAHPTLAHVGR